MKEKKSVQSGQTGNAQLLLFEADSILTHEKEGSGKLNMHVMIKQEKSIEVPEDIAVKLMQDELRSIVLRAYWLPLSDLTAEELIKNRIKDAMYASDRYMTELIAGDSASSDQIKNFIMEISIDVYR